MGRLMKKQAVKVGTEKTSGPYAKEDAKAPFGV